MEIWVTLCRHFAAIMIPLEYNDYDWNPPNRFCFLHFDIEHSKAEKRL
jgi:hypothetical protein